MDDGREYIYIGQLRCLNHLHLMTQETATKFLHHVINPKDFEGAYLEEIYAGAILGTWDRLCRGEDVSGQIKILGHDYVRVRTETLAGRKDQELHPVRELADVPSSSIIGHRVDS